MIFEDAILNEFIEIVLKLNINIYLVGGALRDSFLGAKSYDYDFAIETTPKVHYYIASYLSNMINAEFKYNDYYNTAKFELNGLDIDLIMARKEFYDKPACTPLIKPSSIIDDLKRRDFTINSMAYDLRKNSLIDIFNGKEDLKKGVIRILHEKSFIDDPIRIFRAIKYSSRFKFYYDDLTKKLIDKALKEGYINLIPMQRIKKEVSDILNEKNLKYSLELINEINILNFVFNENIMLNKNINQKYFSKLTYEEKFACILLKNKPSILELIQQEFSFSREFIELCAMLTNLNNIIEINDQVEIYKILLSAEKS